MDPSTMHSFTGIGGREFEASIFELYRRPVSTAYADILVVDVGARAFP
jgi:hypothetical protein